MLKKPTLDHINQLHIMGQQLSVLQRLYKGYESLIERLLNRYKHTMVSVDSSVYRQEFPDIQTTSIPKVMMPESETLLKVSLRSVAKVRFENLRDRIRLYALNEIQECLDQKDALLMMVCMPSEL